MLATNHNWSVNVHQMGRSIFDPIWAEDQHANQRCEIVHILQGSVRIETDTYTIKGKAGDTVVTPAGTPHRDIFPRGTVFEVYLLHIDWPQQDEIISTYHPQILAKAAGQNSALFARLFKHLYLEFINDQPFQQALVNLKATEILYSLCRHASLLDHNKKDKTSDSNQHSIMERTRTLIDGMLDQAISLDDLAERLGISSYHLSRTFSREHGFTLSQYITRRRMDEAASLLLETKRSIKDIAAQVGYQDSHYFSRVFRAQFEQTPSEYRRQ